MTEIKYLLTQESIYSNWKTGTETGKSLNMHYTPLVNHTFKLYPCGWSVKQEKKLFFSWVSVVTKCG